MSSQSLHSPQQIYSQNQFIATAQNIYKENYFNFQKAMWQFLFEHFVEKYNIGRNLSHIHLLFTLKEITNQYNTKDNAYFSDYNRVYTDFKMIPVYWNTFDKYLNNMPQNGIRLVFILTEIVVRFCNGEIMNHVNMMIYDSDVKALCRFEPLMVDEFLGISDTIDNTIKKHIGHSYQHYAVPTTICPKPGLQFFENMNLPEGFIPTKGFCFVYSVWFAELYMLNPNKYGLSPERIYNHIQKRMHNVKRPESTKIRRYLVRLMTIYKNR